MQHPEQIKAGTQVEKPMLQPDPIRCDREKRFVADDKDLGPGFAAFMSRLEVYTAGMTMLDWFSLVVSMPKPILQNVSS